MKKLTVLIATLSRSQLPWHLSPSLTMAQWVKALVMDPVAALGAIGNVELSEISAQVRVRMERVLAPL